MTCEVLRNAAFRGPRFIISPHGEGLIPKSAEGSASRSVRRRSESAWRLGGPRPRWRRRTVLRAGHASRRNRDLCARRAAWQRLLPWRCGRCARAPPELMTGPASGCDQWQSASLVHQERLPDSALSMLAATHHPIHSGRPACGSRSNASLDARPPECPVLADDDGACCGKFHPVAEQACHCRAALCTR